MVIHAFISHSSEDKAIAERLAHRLGKEKVWVDFWNLDAGDVLPQRIAEAIHASKWFILIASRKAMESRWVRYELNIALIRWIQEADCRIIVMRIDDCKVHTELSPFLRVNCPGKSDEAIQNVAEILLSEEGRAVLAPRERRRRVIDRFSEIAAIERLLHEDIRFIYLCGLYGIGKTTIVERTSEEIFNMPLARFPLTEAHGALRLSLELAAQAKLPFPSPSATQSELIESSRRSVTELMEQGYLVSFDDFENALDEEGHPRQFLVSLFDRVASVRDLQAPIFICTTRTPDLSPLSESARMFSHIMRIRRLTDRDLLYCLQNWLRLALPGQPIPQREKLEGVTPHLFGYPLAARLAAYYIASHSEDALLNEIRYFTQLRIDIAKQLIGRARAQLSHTEVGCLEALAVIDTGASLGELAVALECKPGEVRHAVDKLATTLVVFAEKGRLQIHPIVKDYFWTRVYESGKLKELAYRMGMKAKREVSEAELGNERFIHFCSKAYRLLAISGNLQEATTLVYRFKEELREVSRRLYHAKDYELALQYMNVWLKAQPEDLGLRWLKARCLTRLERYKDAQSELSQLEKEGYRRYRLDHAWGLLWRDQRNLEKAAVLFRKGLDDRPNYIPLLRDLGDVLDRLKDTKGALKVLRRAYKLAPRDAYVVPKYVDVLAKSGQIREALDIMEGAVKTFPEEAVFEHRMSTLLDSLGDGKAALTHANKAFDLSPRKLPEATLHLAALEAKLGSVQRAEKLLRELGSKLPQRIKQVRDNTGAEIRLRQGDLEGARGCLRGYDMAADPYSASVSARIELADARAALGDRHVEMARSRLERAKAILDSALQRFPDNSSLQETRTSAEDLLRELM
ncbi:hypothetical protein ES702_05610 [subsurface metagenome]